jgi:hypothetical protein
MVCSECGRDERLRRRCLRVKTLLAALVAGFLSSSLAQAATCLASAEEVRKVTPNAWPKWTYGPNREKCWYSGEKPVFGKRASSQAPAPPRAAADTASEEDDAEPLSKETPWQAPAPRTSVPRGPAGIASEADDRRLEPVIQPWALEYRWSFN